MNSVLPRANEFARQKIDLGATASEVVAEDAAQPAENPAIPFKNTQVVARVDSEVILMGDVMPAALETLNAMTKGRPVPPAQYRQLLDQVLEQQTQAFVKIKLLYLQAKKKIPEDKFPTALKKMGEGFDDRLIPALMENMQCKTLQELDAKLRATGNSLERLKRVQLEQQIAKSWLSDHVKEDEIIVTHEEMVACYRKNLAEYEHPAAARYEELFVKLSKYATPAAAQAALAAMGNQVRSGVPWTEVAKAKSDGTTAAEGGMQTEIRQGSHASRVVDEAIFSLPVGAMSPILSDLDKKLGDRRGFYIVRVVERKPPWKTPFSEVQQQLAEQIKKRHAAEKQREYLEQVAAGSRVWTMFDAKRAEQAQRRAPDRYQR